MKKRSILIIVLLLLIVLSAGALAACSGCTNSQNQEPDDDKPPQLSGEASITSVQGGQMNGLDLMLEVTDDDEIILANILSASEGANWKVYTDENNKEASAVSFSAKLTDLVDGENIFYVEVKSEDGKKSQIYTLKIFQNCNVTLTLTNDNSEAGTISGAGKKASGSKVTIIAEANAGYVFLGWYQGENKIADSNKSPYTYTMPDVDSTLTAKWEYAKYDVKTNTNNSGAGTLSGAGNYAYKSKVVLKATNNKESAYIFDGWFENLDEPAISTALEYSFTMPSRAITLIAKWSIKEYKLTIVKNIEAAGTVSCEKIEGSEGMIKYGEGVTLAVTHANPNGYWFDGWFEGVTNKGTQTEYSFTMPDSDVTVEAKWTVRLYNVNVNHNIETTLITTTGSNPYDYNTEVTIETSSNAYYDFLGWFDADNVKIYNDKKVTFNMPAFDVNLTAKWQVQQIEISVSALPLAGGLIGGAVEGGGPREAYTLITLKATPNPGYIFSGWYDKDTSSKIEGAEAEYQRTNDGSITKFEARWEAIKCIVSFNANGGNAITDTQEMWTGQEITDASPYFNQFPVATHSGSGKVFMGWYTTIDPATAVRITRADGNGIKRWVSPGTTQNVTQTLYAKWFDTNIEGKGYIRVNQDGTLNPTGGYIQFGEYPQTIKPKSVTIPSPTPGENGYYLGSDGKKYAKITAAPFKGYYKFSNDEEVGTTEYYFEVKPLIWKILETKGNDALVLCESIITNMAYDATNSKYGESAVRTWLIETFYQTAFPNLQKQLIHKVTVDNSAASTRYEDNPNASADTEDRVFLLSYLECSTYGNVLIGSTLKKVTDYAIATGACMDNNMSRVGYWRLRSPNSTSGQAECIDHNGTAQPNVAITAAEYGIAPAIWVFLAE